MAFAALPPHLAEKLWVTIPIIRLQPPYTKVAISLSELVRLAGQSIKLPSVMYHGTSAGSWARSNPKGTLYLTADSEDALWFAYETAAHDEAKGKKPEPIILEIPFRELQNGLVNLEPDWNAHGVDEKTTWKDTLLQFGTISVSGNVEELKTRFRVVERPKPRDKIGTYRIPACISKVAISLPELIRQTNAFSVKRRSGCEPTLIKSRPKELFLEYKVVCHENYSDPRGHDVQVQFDLSQVEKTQDAKRLDVRCNCSCPAFLYWGAQWNINQRDGLLGEARPLLQAPTQRLDLRGNFVICKHCKAVFERILPAVQNNIQNIVRKREVELNKKRLEEAPVSEKEKKLKKRQEEMRRKKEIEKIVKTKDPEKQKKLIDDLLKEEEEGRLGEPGKPEAPPALPPLAGPPAPEKPAPLPAPPPPKKQVVRRDEKATEPTAPVPAPGPRQQPSMDDLIHQEEVKLRQRKQKSPRKQVWNGKEWVWLTEDALEKLLHKKRTSLEKEFLGSITSAYGERIWDGEQWVVPTDDMKFVVEEGGEGGRILTDPMTYDECSRWVRQHPEAGIVNGRFVNIEIVKATPQNTSWEPDLSYFDQELMKGMHIK
jgi:hypothetical protein